MFKRSIPVSLILLIGLAVGLQAQKKAGKKAATTKSSKKAATKKKAAPSTNVAEAYRNQLREWKDLLKELRALRLKYLEAKDAERVALAQRFEAGVKRGNAMIVKVRQTAVAAYKAAPNEDRELRNLLVKIAADEFNRGYYRDSYAIGHMLIENKCQLNDIYAIAGSAAYAIQEFTNAEKYLTRAEETQALKAPGTEYLKDLRGGKVKSLWAQEQKLRKQEEADRKDPKKRLPQVLIKTNRGDIVLELFENEAPDTVGNFISLVEKNFYTNLSFHRVLRNFMAQGGCPVGNGSGGPGYNIKCECLEKDKKAKSRAHFRGSISMAKGLQPNTGGSQFFLCFTPTSFLNGKHTVFGRIIKGEDVLSKIRLRDPDNAKKEDIPDPDKILSAKVLFKRNHEYKPNKVK